MARSPKRNANLLKKKQQLWLDVGAGPHPQPGCITMDKRKLDGIDVVHDAEEFPYPFADQTFSRIILSHVMEHLKPWLALDIMNELWRIMKPEGVLMLAMPYPNSTGFWQDPTHIKSWNEATPCYFDPQHGSGLYGIYKPKPWKVEANVWKVEGNIEIVFRRREEDVAPP